MVGGYIVMFVPFCCRYCHLSPFSDKKTRGMTPKFLVREYYETPDEGFSDIMIQQ